MPPPTITTLACGFMSILSGAASYDQAGSRTRDRVVRQLIYRCGRSSRMRHAEDAPKLPFRP
jgi:hypothetical protein